MFLKHYSQLQFHPFLTIYISDGAGAFEFEASKDVWPISCNFWMQGSWFKGKGSHAGQIYVRVCGGGGCPHALGRVLVGQNDRKAMLRNLRPQKNVIRFTACEGKIIACSWKTDQINGKEVRPGTVFDVWEHPSQERPLKDVQLRVKRKLRPTALTDGVPFMNHISLNVFLLKTTLTRWNDTHHKTDLGTWANSVFFSFCTQLKHEMNTKKLYFYNPSPNMHSTQATFNLTCAGTSHARVWTSIPVMSDLHYVWVIKSSSNVWCAHTAQPQQKINIAPEKDEASEAMPVSRMEKSSARALGATLTPLMLPVWALIRLEVHRELRTSVCSRASGLPPVRSSVIPSCPLVIANYLLVICLVIPAIPLWSLLSHCNPLQSPWNPLLSFCNPCYPFVILCDNLWPVQSSVVPFQSSVIPCNPPLSHGCFHQNASKFIKIFVCPQLLWIDLHFPHTFTHIPAHICWQPCNAAWTGFPLNPHINPQNPSKSTKTFWSSLWGCYWRITKLRRKAFSHWLLMQQVVWLVSVRLQSQSLASAALSHEYSQFSKYKFRPNVVHSYSYRWDNEHRSLRRGCLHVTLTTTVRQSLNCGMSIQYKALSITHTHSLSLSLSLSHTHTHCFPSWDTILLELTFQQTIIWKP